MTAFSIVIPVYGNEENIPSLLARLTELMVELPEATEVVFVVDGSPDGSYKALAEALPSAAFSSQLLQHSRNFGSFAAIRTGLAAAKGETIGVMAADLQEPAELMVEFQRVLASGSVDVAVGRRVARNDPALSSLGSRAFWGLYRRTIARDMPPGGVDVFGCTRAVAQVLVQLDEANSSLVAQLYWVGFRRAEIPYSRQEREHGTSQWTLRKRVKYLLDSVFSFTNLPLDLLLLTGVFGTVAVVVIAVVILGFYLTGGITEPGYVPLMLAILFSTFLTITSIGIVGAYVWRVFDNTKRRPTSIVMSREEW
ncbi:MAG TPA: glycosyltransferase family 2 protein [Microbacteriaceae bacterium]|jgi:glycosyltransferase involved in cell wall biosynthesis|nr:glycosyltransferase family 2 protein [Actinomycetota bacterium]HOA86146.1 glycosyltransferase family 2 protein [Microbacteriaceae bacterium]HQA22687.1 glycosyltransferase family 2 protein [Rhodoglobus sp.]HQE45811.1 glycosyltransferase family 2 protein [Rhodoglobus sp.]